MTSIIALTLAAAAVAAPPAPDGPAWNFRMNVDHEQPLTSCAQMDVSVRDGQLARAEEVVALPAGSTGVTVRGFVNGGVYARGGTPDYTVKLCKFAAAATAAEAEARLAEISLSVRDGAVGVAGPAERRDWMAHLIVLAPSEAQVDLETHNGPLSVRAMSGRIAARTMNGPVSVSACSGKIDVSARNGPVSISEISGDVRAVATNGPLSVRLSGDAWNGPGLDARADNGPLSVRVPDGYQSGVRIDMSRHSPLNCRAAICREGVRLGEEGRSLSFGAPEAQVRLSSQNGPVSIASARD